MTYNGLFTSKPSCDHTLTHKVEPRRPSLTHTDGKPVEAQRLMIKSTGGQSMASKASDTLTIVMEKKHAVLHARRGPALGGPGSIVFGKSDFYSL